MRSLSRGKAKNRLRAWGVPKLQELSAVPRGEKVFAALKVALKKSTLRKAIKNK
jgi:hypothetical protein